MKADFGKTLEKHIKEVRQLRSQLLKDQRSPAAHFCWAARRVCLRWKWSHIAEENGAIVTWQAVRKAVVSVLTRIGIPPKHNQSGSKITPL